MDKNDRFDTGEVDQATITFPFDRMTVQRFRKEFPRARWSDWHKAWLVPGKTASRRIERWLEREASRANPFAEEKGRDAYEFEPILSSYLSVDSDGISIKTPYSKRLVEEIRQISFARWDPHFKMWRVPFASYDELLQRWETIENEARRSEPEERLKRTQARKGSKEERRERLRANERRRRRIPLTAEALPPLNRPITTQAYGIIVIREITGELVNSELINDVYPDLEGDYVWGFWRLPSLDELVQTWPNKKDLSASERQRGWWHPDLEELREGRRVARTRARARRAVSAATD
ncbi:hypothetical protein [Brucella pseudogrignonensis]|nr:hypothetical protein [Brucella pseudogrignonensis]